MLTVIISLAVLLMPSFVFAVTIEELLQRQNSGIVKKNTNTPQKPEIKELNKDQQNPNQEIENRLKSMRTKKPLTKLPEHNGNKYQEPLPVITIKGSPEKQESIKSPEQKYIQNESSKPLRLDATSTDNCSLAGYTEKDGRRLELLDCGSFYQYREIK